MKKLNSSMTKIVGAHTKKFGNGRQFWDDNVSAVGCLTFRTITNRLVFEKRTKQVEQSSAIRCDLWRRGSSNGNLTVTFTGGSNAQNLSKYHILRIKRPGSS